VQQVVDLICEQFDLYYVGLYLLGESGRWAVLRAGTGEAGRQMMEQGHRLMVAGTSLVGWCTANAKARNVGDTGGQMTGLDTRLLPQTCSEMALPLRSRGRVIGALDVHSSQPEAFSEEDVAVFQTLADQLAAAIDNAQLLAEAQARVEEVEASQQRYLRERWAELTSVDGAPVYERSRSDVEPLGEAIPAEADLAIVRQEMVVQSEMGDGARQAALVVPIRVRDEVIGALGLQETEGGRQWTADEIALIEAVADQLALAIENARLLAETRRRAERERLVTEISARVRASVDPDTILKTAVRELSQALGAERAAVQVTGPAESAADAPEEEPVHGEEMS
jgi:GAF domain-containing protein